MTTQLILHHYDFSNFSEKIRLVLGLKDLTWHSVEIPSHLPKPNYTPLTGGYRRTPALQIGADIYCDTALIARELEKRFPANSIYGTHDPEYVEATWQTISPWAESTLLWPTALYITGVHADRFPNTFHQDRAYLHNKPVPSAEQVRRAGENYYSEMLTNLAMIEPLLKPQESFLCGSQPTIVDFTVFGAPWLLEQIGGDSTYIDKYPRVRAWMSAVSHIGHGDITTMDAQQALAIARDTPISALVSPNSNIPNNVSIGETVDVNPRDERSPATGKLQLVNDDEIVIVCESELSGETQVHFPRLGYRVSRHRVS